MTSFTFVVVTLGFVLVSPESIVVEPVASTQLDVANPEYSSAVTVFVLVEDDHVTVMTVPDANPLGA